MAAVLSHCTYCAETEMKHMDLGMQAERNAWQKRPARGTRSRHDAASEWNRARCGCVLQCSAVQYSTAQYSTVQFLQGIIHISKV